MENIESNYDAIVIGTGVSGGWAAKELTENEIKSIKENADHYVSNYKKYKK